MNNLTKGAQYLLQGFSVMNRPGIRHFAYIPMLINTLLFAVGLWYGFSHFDTWMQALMPDWLPEWLEAALMWIVWPLFVLLTSVIVFFTFSIIANIIAAPFNGILAEMVEKHISGETPPELPWNQIFKDAPKMIKNELIKTAYLLRWMIPLLLLSWIPIVNIVAPLLWFYFSSWTLALDYHDYPMGNHQLFFREQRAILRQHKSLALGFGGATMVATMIPIVNFLVIPAAVCGATVLYSENLKNTPSIKTAG